MYTPKQRMPHAYRGMFSERYEIQLKDECFLSNLFSRSRATTNEIKQMRKCAAV